MKQQTLVRSSKHSIKFANTGKQALLRSILTEYRDAVNFYIDYLWTNRVEWTMKDGSVHVFDLSDKRFELPTFISTSTIFPARLNLSARFYKSAATQAIGIVASIINKHKKLLFKLDVSIARGNIDAAEKLQKRVDDSILTMSRYDSIAANLDSNTLEFIPSSDSHFDGFLKIHSLSRTKYGRNILLPIKFTRHNKKLIDRGFVQMTSWILTEDSLNSLWSKPKPDKKTAGKKVGADQGVKTCLTLSDGQITGECLHGHTLESIMQKISRLTKGSKAFARAQAHRTNYINWSVKQLNLDDINEIGYENVKDIRKGKNSSNLMKAWTYTEIRTAVGRLCEEAGVQLTEQGSIYRSQRCSDCGFVHKKNRNKKTFRCIHCNHELDSDLNGALNHEVDLVEVPYSILSLKLNMKGFFWKESGMFDLNGQEIAVPGASKTKT